MSKQQIVDWLFRLGLYRGVSVEPPMGLVECALDRQSQTSAEYVAAIDTTHEVAPWLLYDCEGPWSIRLRRPYKNRQTYVAFARTADAVMFKLMF